MILQMNTSKYTFFIYPDGVISFVYHLAFKTEFKL